MIEPRGAGMVQITLRASEEVRAAAFPKSDADIDAEMVAIARTIIERRSGHFDPAIFRDRYQEALRELIEAKMKGLPVEPKQIAAPVPVLDLMAALKRSLAREKPDTAMKPKRKAAADRRQTSLLLPVSGKKETAMPAAETALAATARFPERRRQRCPRPRRPCRDGAGKRDRRVRCFDRAHLPDRRSCAWSLAQGRRPMLDALKACWHVLPVLNGRRDGKKGVRCALSSPS